MMGDKQHTLADFVVFDEAQHIGDAWIKREWLAACKRREDHVRDCLGRWVSELEPTLIYRDREFLGLGLDGGDGTVFVAVRPLPTDPQWYFFDEATSFSEAQWRDVMAFGKSVTLTDRDGNERLVPPDEYWAKPVT